PGVMAAVAIIGTLTALWAALIATTQTDIKKVLAYSTVSQLGYMFVGVGAGAFFAGSMHLVTHAFFKACLFLGSGSVIHGMHHEQDMTKMGGLRQKMPATAMTFLIATIAITGVLPISGFISKDEILAQVANTGVYAQLSSLPHDQGFHFGFLGPVLYVVGSITALLTSFYMWRCYFMTFEGSYRGPSDHHPHESPGAMTLPLWILAGLSVVAVVLGLPEGWVHGFSWEHFTEGLFATPRGHEGHFLSHFVGYAIAIVVAWVGFFIARMNYVTATEGPARFTAAWPRLYKTLLNKLYVDEFYDFIIGTPLWKFAKGLWAVVDRVLIDGLLVNGPAQVVSFVGSMARRFQNGDVQRYAAVTALGVAALVWVLLR
ncbi:MAG: NADH-quinone oxidoreductase subunit L, partial [Deltaproteobacteria bacterium]|nr:NADH-quinone oxidoreductase subunit L [Deltaproteobacteria bacterium]